MPPRAGVQTVRRDVDLEAKMESHRQSHRIGLGQVIHKGAASEAAGCHIPYYSVVVVGG